MNNEIERKFLISKMPDLSNFESVTYERYYIYRNDTIEMRVQRKGNIYEIERKEMTSGLSAKKTKLVISEPEFEKLKQFGSEAILREGFFISSNPDVSIKIYHGKYEGLNKVEVEFTSEEEAKAFQIPKWYGEEITDSLISRDSKLLDLSEEEIKNFLSDKTRTE
jgi:adenylate cyclase